jgi:3-deoxy-D-manno-octulosonate 8-phosphate phosphatase (KDO 8-P phosphatase)
VTARAASIRLLCLDVDGVLTDGTVHLDDLGHETKRFNVKDGLGLSLWKRLGGEVAVITGRSGLAVRHRLEELGVRHLYSGSKNKFDDIRAAANACGVPLSAVAFVGDDLPDLPAMRACGYPVAVHDAAAEVRAVASFVTTASGGHGAVREVVEHLLRTQNRWNEALAMFDSPSAPGIRAGAGGVQHERPEQHDQPQST